MPDPIIPVTPLPPGIQSVMPVHARKGVFVPEVGRMLNVTLPGEIVRCEVEAVYGHDVALVRITSIVAMTREHGFKRGDPIPVKRGVGQLDTEIWEPIDEREEREKEARETAARAARQPVEEEPIIIPTGTHESAEANSLGLAESFRQSEAAEPAPPARRGWWSGGKT